MAHTPHYCPCDMVKGIASDYGVRVPYHQAWCGRELAVRDLHGDVRTSYDMLRWYSERVMEMNPGSIIDMVVDEETHRFKSYFLYFAACVYGYEVGCRPLIFLDGSHITDKMQGVILAASALNGNDELFTIAFTVADLETYENWKWFLHSLKKALLSERPIVFISDRVKGLKEVVLKIFPMDHHGYCLRHIMAKFMIEAAARYRKALKDSMVKTLNKVAFALTESEHLAALSEMERKFPEAKDWILRNDVEHWANAQFPGERYGHMYSNLAESFSAWIKLARSLPILQMVETICRQIMEMGGRRRTEATNWETTLCPTIEKVLAKIMFSARQNSVIPSDGRLFEVVNGNKTYVVNISEWTCSCHKWQLLKIPCEHACAAITCSHKPLYDHVSPFYTTNTYRAAYAVTVNPINNNDMPCMNINDIQVKPSITKRLPRWPRKK
ncbi:hypothetical protein Taro_043599 [Colocasia esculenta]|uniref:SWIM-type domain-containing protein n=1 Tax=Colocasia esculenta TaxID=4460 RepID=A0A843WLI4_COLES|nr:hypothetical protein [Colocasia esculenta]